MSEKVNDGWPSNDGYRRKRGARGNNEKRFFSNAKGFGKKGNFGRGSHIEEDQFTYFIGILDALRAETNSVDEKVPMANNVMEQTKDNEINLASNQVVCKAIEVLIGFSDAEHLERFIDVFGENVRPICSDVFASHVLQKMMEIAFLRAFGKKKILEDEENVAGETPAKRTRREDVVSELTFALSNHYTKEHRKKCADFVERMCKFLLNNLEDFMLEACGCHLLRACALYCAGIHIAKVPFARGQTVDSQNSIKQTHFEVPTEWNEIGKEFFSRMEMWPQLPDLPYTQRSANLLGAIAIALARIDKSAFKHFAKKLLKEAFVGVKVSKPSYPYEQPKPRRPQKQVQADVNDEQKAVEPVDDNFASVFKTEGSLFLLETIISLLKPSQLKKYYNTLFGGHLVELAKGQLTNFTVQKLLNCITEKELFEIIFDKLAGHIRVYVESGHTGLVRAISSACLRLNARQSACVTALTTALICGAADEGGRSTNLFNCLLQMKPSESIASEKLNYVSLHGSLIIQDILQFNKPIFMVNCILQTKPGELVSAFQFPNGSHIADAFLTSKYIGEKSRENFTCLFTDYYTTLATSRSGSRVLEKMFFAASDYRKSRIASELTLKENMLKGSMCGRIIYNILRLKKFGLSREQWVASWKHANKTDEMINEIVNKVPAVSAV